MLKISSKFKKKIVLSLEGKITVQATLALCVELTVILSAY